mmetsp:Transcript_44297/g.32304  ORF Transcript_44297/g.32304 Transcript_44297/m.32304 type:complete len:103 (+) Transcript_44297:421-729(+)
MKNVTTSKMITQGHNQVPRPAAAHLQELQNFLSLAHISKACSAFDVAFSEVASHGLSASESEKYMMRFFKFPGATYLTSTMFSSVGSLLGHFSPLISSRKSS